MRKKVLSFLLTLFSLGLGYCAGPAEKYKGTRDTQQIVLEHSYVPGNVVGIRDIEGNQKFKGLTFMELIFYEEKT